MVRFNLLTLSVILVLGTTQLTAQNGKNTVSGSVFNDLNKNKLFDNEQVLRGWFVKITDHAAQQSWFVSTDAQGNYSAEIGTGEHTIEVIAPNSYWLPSQRSTILNFPTLGNTLTHHFAVSAAVNCHAMQVQVTAADASQRCQESTLAVRYSNNGTQSANGAYIDVNLPEQVNFKSAAAQFSLLDGGRTVRLYLGDIPVNDFGEIGIQTQVNCDAPEGATSFCYQAQAYPNTPCGNSTVATGGGGTSIITRNNGGKFGSNIIIEDEIIFRRPTQNTGTTTIGATTSQNDGGGDFSNTSIRFFGDKPTVMATPTVSKECKRVVFDPISTGNGTKNIGLTKDKPFSFVHFTPNPLIDLTTILLPENLTQSAVFELYDMAGRLQKRENLSGRQYTLYRQNLPSGMYFYRMVDGKEVLNTGKLVIK